MQAKTGHNLFYRFDTFITNSPVLGSIIGYAIIMHKACSRTFF
jgi:hypothetical protein